MWKPPTNTELKEVYVDANLHRSDKSSKNKMNVRCYEIGRG